VFGSDSTTLIAVLLANKSGDDLDNKPVLASNSTRELNGPAASFNDVIVGLCG
jgi:hypothetical protein